MTNSISSAEVTGSDGIIWRDAPWWKFEPEAHHDVTMATGNGIRLTLAKPFARPGERWNEVMVDVHPTSVSIEKTCLRVRLFEHGTIDIVEEVSLRPQSSSG
ncbi:hypothetical protein H8E77_24770, partial [bacterium]|nr:hypothetical protein [bacterium]